ncbi:MAG: hypothetical protein JW896_00760 [Deltaproteobacteria bacterium]|nr:hypothetical protein [Deltaproteobacteria bacterium]
MSIVSQEIAEALYSDNRAGDSIVFPAKDGIFDKRLWNITSAISVLSKYDLRSSH